MNKKQLIVLAIGILAVAACFLYPPWKSPRAGSTYVQYAWFWEPPSFLISGGYPGGPPEKSERGREFDWNKIFVQVAGILLLSGVGVVLCKVGDKAIASRTGEPNSSQGG